MKDIMPTCMDLAGASYPATYGGNAIQPHEGKSFMSVINNTAEAKTDTIFWEHEGGKAARVGNWKIVALKNKAWQLYDLSNDISETNNLALQNTAKLNELKALWTEWAIKVGLVDVPSTVDTTVSLLFHYPFNGNLNDSSANNHVLSSVTSHSFTTGKYGQALELNGIDQYLDLNTENLLDPSKSTFTICAWVNNNSKENLEPTSKHEEVVLAQKDGSSDAVGRIYLYYELNSNDGRFKSFVANGANYSSVGSFRTDEWIHVAAVYNPATKKISWYVNGTKDSEVTTSKSFESTTGGFRIGAHKDGTKNFWDGKIDELYLYKGILSEEKINEIKNNTSASSERFIQEEQITLYVNSNELIVTGNQCRRIHLFNVAGVRLKSIDNGNIMDISQVPSGCYILFIETSSGNSVTKKIIVNK
ncbi:MAG: T9SS type A sorting domain-containing protein [Bacteroidales bacterium]|nr:T9SS type A sorting domain-containing protein [Bacteroidales bacterium]